MVQSSTSSGDIENLAIDLAYNFVICGCYANIIFSWESGKILVSCENRHSVGYSHCIGLSSMSGKDALKSEIHQMALGCARYMLNFAQSAQEKLIPNALEVRLFLHFPNYLFQFLFLC